MNSMPLYRQRTLSVFTMLIIMMNLHYLNLLLSVYSVICELIFTLQNLSFHIVIYQNISRLFSGSSNIQTKSITLPACPDNGGFPM